MNGFTFEEIKFFESIRATVSISSETMDCYGGFLYGNESVPIFRIPYVTNITIDVDLANVGSDQELQKLFNIQQDHPTCHWNIYTTTSTEAWNRYSNNTDKEIDKEIDAEIFDILNGE